MKSINLCWGKATLLWEEAGGGKKQSQKKKKGKEKGKKKKKRAAPANALPYLTMEDIYFAWKKSGVKLSDWETASARQPFWIPSLASRHWGSETLLTTWSHSGTEQQRAILNTSASFPSAAPLSQVVIAHDNHAIRWVRNHRRQKRSILPARQLSCS